MASKRESSEGIMSQLEGSINADVFAPKIASHIPRAWERRPVSGHAPRLNGKRVWKRPGHKPKPDETNYEMGIVELGKDGAGARKRLRQTGARDAIANATWDNKSSQKSEHAEDAIDPAQLSPVKSQPLSIIRTLGVIEPEHTVPRKRTNVNHILTPKKRSRQVTLEHFASVESSFTTETESKLENEEGRGQRRKSIRKSIRRSIMPTVDLSPAITHSPQLGVFDMRSAPSPSPRKRSMQTSPTKTRSPQKLAIQNIFGIAETSVIEVGKEVGSRQNVRRSTRSTRASSIMKETVEPLDITFNTTVSEPAQVEPAEPEAADVAMEGIEDNVVEPLVTAIEEVKTNMELPEPTNDSVPAEDTTVTEDSEVQESVETVEQAEEHCSDETTFEMPETITNITERPSSASSESSLSEISTPTMDDIPDLASEQLLGEQATQPLSDDIDLGFISPIKASEALALISSPIVTSARPESEEDLPASSDPQSQESDSTTEVAKDYHKDDTDMLLNFLTRVKADKAAKAQQSPSRKERKRSLPHSPLRLPLGDVDTNLSPSPKRSSAPDFDAIIEPPPSPTKTSPSQRSKSKRENPLSVPLPEEDTATINTPIRRSGRTRLPVKKDPIAGPSHIPVRRLGQDADNTVTLKRNVDKELAAVTRVNTRKNKGGALSANDMLAKLAETKDDPIMRQKLLKDAFNDKEKRKAGKKAKSVVWAEELVHFQTEKKVEEVKEKKEVKVGVRSKIAVGMGNGTPAPKRRRGKA